MQAAVTIFTIIITILISSLQPVSAEPFPSTKTIQQILKSRGYNITVVDGVFGPQTAAAIRELQKKFGLKITGAVNKEVVAALNPAGERLLPTVMQVQKELKLRGYNVGIVDGLFGPGTSLAIKSYQKNSGIAETGYINLSVAKALRPPTSRDPPVVTPVIASRAGSNDEKSKTKLVNSALGRTPREKTTRSEGSTTKEENIQGTPVVAPKKTAKTPDKTLVIKGPRITDRFVVQKPPPKTDNDILETDKQPISPTTPGPNKSPEERSWQFLDWLVLLLVLWGSWKLYQGVMWVWGVISRRVPTSRVQKASPEQGSGIDVPIVVQGTNHSEVKYFIEDELDLTAELEAENTPGNSDQNVGPVEVKGAGGLVTFKLDLSPQPEQFIQERPSNIEEATTPRRSIFGKARKNCWVAKGAPVIIAGIEIANGMLYVGANLPTQRGYSGQDNCLINPRLKVARNSYGADNDYMPYWPSYSNISPKNRRQYLEWLAKGARTPDAYIGYVFLYFYGLERRLFMDQDADDRWEVVTEIRRLLAVYSENHSVSRYLNEALSFAEIILGKNPSLPLLQIAGSYNWELPLGVRIYLGEKLKESSTLSIDDMLVWFINHPERALRTPATRLKEHCALLPPVLKASFLH